MTYLTVPIAGKTIEQCSEQIRKAVGSGAAMLELRTDYLENLTVELARQLFEVVKSQAKKVPYIVTCRDAAQGGAADYPVELRVDVLVAGSQAGANYVDFEMDNFLFPENRGKIRRALSQSIKGKLIISAHNFKGRFENVMRLYRKIMTLYPAAVPKIVYTANHITDCFEAFDLLHSTSGERIVFCMGEAGMISRILAVKLGSLITFASLGAESATAAGQVTIEQIKNIYRFNAIGPQTEIYGLIGSPVGHSLGPLLHNMLFADIKADKLYLPMLVDGSMDGFREFMRMVVVRPWLSMKGFSVTIPHKENAFLYVNEKHGVITANAQKIAAVNTITITNDGKIKAFNTDYSGAIDAIVSGLKINPADLKDMPAAVIGAGGVARSVVAGLCNWGAKVTIYNRTVEKAQKLASEFNCSYAPLNELRDPDAKLIINCTSIGMSPEVDKSPITKGLIQKDMTVFDTVYNPINTELLKEARQSGAKTISGIDMFVNQAAEQFKLFTGVNPSVKMIKAIISKAVI